MVYSKIIKFLILTSINYIEINYIASVINKIEKKYKNATI